MKNIVGVAFLILVTAHVAVGFSLDGMLLYNMLHAVAIDYISSYKEDLFKTNCNGICLPKSMSNVCQIVYTNGGCSTSSVCCLFQMRIEINLPNVTDQKPLSVSKLTVNIPANMTLKDKEISTEDIITNIPSTTYKTTDVLELDGEKNKIKEEDGGQDTVHELSTTSEPQKNSGRECNGECVSGIVSLLCNDIDTDASCPSEERCCLQSMATSVTTSSPTTTQ